MNPIEEVKKLIGSNRSSSSSQNMESVEALRRHDDIIFSPRLFFAIEAEAKKVVAEINIKLMPFLNDIMVEDEDLHRFIGGMSFQEMEKALIAYYTSKGTQTGMAQVYVKERLTAHGKRKESILDGKSTYVTAPAEIPDTIQPYVMIKRDKDNKRFLDLDTESLKRFAMVKATPNQMAMYKKLQEIAQLMNLLKNERGDLHNHFMQYIINDFHNNKVYVDKEWLVTGIKSVDPFLSANLYALKDLSQA